MVTWPFHWYMALHALLLAVFKSGVTRYRPTDRNGTVSSVSAALAERLSLSTHKSRCSASVTVPTIDGAFTSTLRLDVIRDLGFQLILGADWIGLCRAAATDGLTAFPPSSPESRPNEHLAPSPCMPNSHVSFSYLIQLITPGKARGVCAKTQPPFHPQHTQHPIREIEKHL
jgi:hypothetical protein